MTLPSWFGDERRRINRKSQQQERARARETGGRVSAGSGSSWRQPQDVRTDSHLEQLKTTSRASFSIKADEWKKIRKDAHNAGLEPLMLIDFEEHGIRLLVVEA